MDEKEVIVTSGEGSNTASSLIWAITILALAGILVWGIFFSGALKSSPTKKVDVDVNISAPARQ